MSLSQPVRLEGDEKRGDQYTDVRIAGRGRLTEVHLEDCMHSRWPDLCPNVLILEVMYKGFKLGASSRPVKSMERERE